MVDITDAERAQEIFYNEAMGDATPLAPGDELDNAVHPLFRQSNISWSDLKEREFRSEDAHINSDNAYAAMLPALRLATLLVTTLSMMKPFDHVANGLLVEDAPEDIPLAKGEYEGTLHGKWYLYGVLHYLASAVDICFWDIFFETSHMQDKNAMASANHEPAVVNGQSHLGTWNKEFQGQTHVFKIHHGLDTFSFRAYFLEYFSEHIQHDRPEHKLASMFLFVRTLVHEVMHFVNYFSHGVQVSHIDENGVHLCPQLEPRYNQSQEMRELGQAYESWLLGGHLGGTICQNDMTAPKKDAKRVVFMPLYKWVVDPEDVTDCTNRSYDNTQYFLTTKVVQMWWSKSVWEKIRKEGHGFIIEEMCRSTYKHEQDRHILSYDGVVYKNMRDIEQALVAARSDQEYGITDLVDRFAKLQLK
jgi:hypothetical protein